MVCGLYNCSGGPVGDLDAVRRLEQFAAGSELTIRGPLAIVGGGRAFHSAEVDGIIVLLDGRLYGQGGLGAQGAAEPELVARRYRRVGAELLTGLRGRFSLVVWDGIRQQGLLTCDLLATKQLFVSRGAGWLAFASELHELLQILPSRPGPDPVGFLTWLAAGTCPAGQTLYEGVSRLGPGELIELRARATASRTYWRPGYTGTVKGTRAELAEGLRDELERSTARRLSPGSTGVVLSGGLDSSIVTAFASRAKPPGARLQTYSAVFPGSEFDETAKIRELTTAVGIEPAALEFEPQGTLWTALQHTKQWGLPLTGAGALIDIAVVAEAARDGVEVVLDGQTGDEVLGFAPYLVADRIRSGRLLGALELAGRWPLGRPMTRRDKIWILKNVGLKGAAPYRLGQFVRNRRDRDTGPAWLLPTLRSQSAELEDQWAWKAGASGPRWWQHMADVLIQAPHRELRLDYLRHRAAGVDVVNESPLYDFDLIDYVLRLPPELAFDSRFTRPLARLAVRGIVPEAVRLQSQKAVFSSLCFDAITGADSPGIERLLTAHDAELGAYVDMEFVRNYWHHERPRAGGSSMSWGTTVWRLVAGECWLRLQADPSFIDEMLACSDVPAPSVRSVRLAGTGTFFPLVQAPTPG
jgi:asparagine synthetase B (glutamine-hydrolysing)